VIDTLVNLGFVVGGFFGALILIGVYVLFFPEKAEKVGGWIASLLGSGWRRADRAAVKFKVQADVNGLRATLHSDAPEMIDKALKISWTNAEEAEAVVRGGDVVVFMRDSRRHEENLANAVMAFLPKALLSRARRYVEPDTMRAIDFAIAKALLADEEASEGALEVFYDRHLDPARQGSERLRAKITEIDAIDLHGWLSRILLAEYRRIGEMLYPADPDGAVLHEAEELADWLYKLAARKKDELGALKFRGRYFRVAIIFVGLRATLEEHGSTPYRRRAKQLIYHEKFDAVYLLARDPNLYAVKEILESLKSDTSIASQTCHSYRLRRDFQARLRLRREHGICACLRRKDAVTDPPPDEPSEEDVLTAVPTEEYVALDAPRDEEAAATSVDTEVAVRGQA
jgi:hypothetical protein